MSTGDNKINIYLKKFLPQQHMVDNFLEFLLKQNKEAIELLYPDQGFFFGNSLAPGGNDEVVAATPMQAVDGLANVLRLDPADATAKFENTLGITYYVGARYAQIRSGTEVNVRTGKIEYTFIQDAIGEKGDPDSVIDNGSTLTLTVDGVTEAGVSNAGRKAIVYLKQAVSQADAFFVGTVTWNGSNNIIDTTNLIGQTAGLVSTDPADYVVFIPGLTIRRNTDLSLDPNVVFYGEITGTGAGNPLTVGDINTTGSNLLFSGGAITPIVDSVKAFLVGGGDISWDLDSETLSFANDFRLKIPGRPYDFQILATTVNSFADGEAIYIDRTGLGGIKPLIKSTIAAVPNDPTADVIAIRFGDMIYFRNGSLELLGETGEATIGKIDGTTEDTLTYLGARSEGDAAPAYSVKLGGTQNKHILEGDNLTLGIKKLDARNDVVVKVKTIDFDSGSLPTTIPMVIHGQTVNVGEQVLFIGLNRIYKLTDDNSGAGPAVWTEQEAFNNVAIPENLSLVGVQSGEEDFIETVYQYTSGRGWRPLDSSELMSEPTGFRDRSNSTFSFVNGTRTFTIQPLAPATKYFYTQMGKVFRKAAAENLVIPDTEGLHYIFFDGNTLTSTTTFSLDIITGKVFVATLYWNQVDQEATLIADERHGSTMDGPTHAYLHNTNGMQYASGLGITAPTSGDGSADADAQVDLDGGVVYDEDLVHQIVHSDTPSDFYEQDLQGPGQIPVFYRLGASGYWKKDAATDFPLKAGTARPQFNQLSGSWSAIDSTADGKFIAMYIIATNDVNNPIIAIMGQREDDNLADAQANNTIDTLDLTGLPTLEFKPLYRVIYETDSTYGNSINARQLDVTDLRFAETLGSGGGLAPTDHNALAGRSAPGAHPSQAITTEPSDFGGAASAITLNQKQFNKALDDHFKALRITEHPSNKQRVVVSGASVLLDSGVVLEQQIRNLIVSFDGMQIDFQTGEIFESDGTTPFNGGANDFTPVIPPASENRWASIILLPSTVNANNTINYQPLVLISDADNKRAAFATGTKIGQVKLEENAAAIANITEAGGSITRQGVGGSGDGGSGNANSFLEDLKRRAHHAFWRFFTPNIFSLSEDTEEDSANTTATYDIANSEYDFDFVAGTPITPITTSIGTTVNSASGDSSVGHTGQSFTTIGAFNLNQVTVPMGGRGLAGNIQVEIWELTGGIPDPTKVLATSTPRDRTTFAEQVTNNAQDEIFVFPTAPLLAAATEYAAMYVGDTANLFDCGGENSDSYPGGKYWFAAPPLASTGDLSEQVGEEGRIVVEGTTPGGGQVLATINQFGSRFLGTSAEIKPEADKDAAKIEVWALFTEGKEDPAPIVRASRDGRNEFQTVPMFRHGISPLFTGELTFQEEAANQTLHELAEAAADSQVAFTDSGLGVKRSFQFVVTNKEAQKELSLYLQKTGSPLGKMTVNVFKDDGGLPSTNPQDRIGGNISADDIDVAALSAGNNTAVIPIGRIITKPGTYWCEIVSDQDYKNSYNSGVDEILLRVDTAGTEPDGAVFDDGPGTWALTSNEAAVYKLEGMAFDLRIEIESSQADVSLEAMATFYTQKALEVSQGLKLRHVERFDASTNPNVFTIPAGKFLPDPDQLEVFDVSEGKVYKYPAFGIDGHTITFPENTFLGDLGTDVMLIFDQSKGTGFDNSDINAALMAASRLGSEDAAIDKSVAGEGPMLRADNGKLVEVSLREKMGGGYEWVFAEVN